MSSWTSPALGVKFSPEKNKTQERNFYESLVILRTLEEWVTCESLWLWDLNCGMTKSINKTLKELIFFRLNFPFFGDCYIVVHSVFEISRAERWQPSQCWAGWCQYFHQILLTSLTLTFLSTIFPFLTSSLVRETLILWHKTFKSTWSFVAFFTLNGWSNIASAQNLFIFSSYLRLAWLKTNSLLYCWCLYLKIWNSAVTCSTIWSPKNKYSIVLC